MKTLIAAAAVAALLGLSAGAAQSAEQVKVGLLTCDVGSGFGYIIGSDKTVDCWFKPAKGGKSEHYTGSIKKLGLDVGYTVKGKLAWLVFAATGTKYSKHALAGQYVGASAEQSFIVGLGANWLVGGSKKSFALQPFSVQGTLGLNASLTWSNLSLN
ncbi:MAG: DUF992 domain-containing protein [Devosia sp.]